MNISLNNNFTASITTLTPPIKEYKIFPVKDSYILSNNPRTNYGEYNSAQISNSLTNNSAAMFEFSGLQDIPAKVLSNLIDARIVLTFSNKIKSTRSFNVYDYNSKSWFEQFIYWENAPAKGELLETVTVNKDALVANLNISEALRSQISAKQDTLGIYVDSDEAASNSPLSVYTKEHYRKANHPVIIIRYFDIPGTPVIREINSEENGFIVKRESEAIIDGEVSVGMYSVKADIDSEGFIVPKFTVFDMTAVSSDDTIGYDAGFDAVSNANIIDEVQTGISEGTITESVSSGDMITGELTVATSAGTEVISGTIDIPRLFIFTMLFKMNNKVVYTFPAGENIEDYEITEPYNATEVDGGEISCDDVFVYGFAGYHNITGEIAVSNPVDILDIIGEVSVSNPIADQPTITGEIGITPVVMTDLECTENGFKVPKLFTVNTTFKDKDGEVIYTLPVGEDIDNYEVPESYASSEVDGGEITGTGLETFGRRTANIVGTVTAALEGPTKDIKCEKWEVDVSNYFDADLYIAARTNKDITCEISDVDYTHYTDANMYNVPMMSKPTYYDKSGNKLPDKNYDMNDPRVYRIEYTRETCILGNVGVPTTDPTICDLDGTLEIAIPVEGINDITCEISDVDYTHYTDANMYVNGRIVKMITGKITPKFDYETTINGEFVIAYPVEGIDDITCEKSNVDYTNYDFALMYVKGLKVNDIVGEITPKFAVSEDINGSITIYAKINNGGWIDCDKTEVDNITVHYTDANMFVVRTVEDTIEGEVGVRGSVRALINGEISVSKKVEDIYINGVEFDISHKADDTFIDGTLDIREAILAHIDGEVTIEASKSAYSYGFII